MPYLSALEVCSRQGAIQIHIYLHLTLLYKCNSICVAINRARSTTVVQFVMLTPEVENWGFF